MGLMVGGRRKGMVRTRQKHGGDESQASPGKTRRPTCTMAFQCRRKGHTQGKRTRKRGLPPHPPNRSLATSPPIHHQTGGEARPKSSQCLPAGLCCSLAAATATATATYIYLHHLVPSSIPSLLSQDRHPSSRLTSPPPSTPPIPTRTISTHYKRNSLRTNFSKHATPCRGRDQEGL